MYKTLCTKAACAYAIYYGFERQTEYAFVENESSIENIFDSLLKNTS